VKRAPKMPAKMKVKTAIITAGVRSAHSRPSADPR
jgi:hypothetical protein